ncbi:E3 ubiquitin ligase BIG BROTHER-related-like isoform X1 [Tripterygium wilfordii]|uniref:E3 ubiquitin ligase BIG BROTHER-related-like isoform X1 n=1 Tax=Tripterygium wilfordii TaxID=458696 RepID=A0A7J7CV28_TRIWF|nr:E3 ubiquitin ligase BIG BROTHER-related [Tripterygium wilfordii]KAF5737940.1 E3 ubiquitin ligase BIG BROTHER-related-like isoform X1 [Tripterygium wilfordii]
MEGDAKVGSGDRKTNDGEQEQGENPNLNEQEAIASNETLPRQSSTARTPFTNLTQEEADLALARTLQEQERAYMLLSMNNNGSDYGSWEGSYLHDDEDDFDDADADTDVDEDDGTDADDNADAFDVHAHSDGEANNPSIEFDPDVYSSDEAYARALQEAEEREMATRLLALTRINDGEAEDSEDDDGNSQDTWEEVDPDELSYEELLALGEVVGSESRGLSADTIASLPSVNYKAGSSQNGSNDSCVICRLDYEDDETLTVLSCKHSYHSECINNWLKINKVCPVCSAEVSTSGHS